MTRLVQRGSQDLMRAMNANKVLNAIRLEKRGITRLSIAQQLGLQPSTISGIVEPLIDTNLVIERRQRVGEARPALLLELNSWAGLVVGVRVDRTHIEVVLMNLAGDNLKDTTEKLPSTEPNNVTSAIAKTVRRVLSEYGRADLRVIGIGVALVGIVDFSTGTCRSSFYMNWHDIDMRERLAAALPEYDVYVDNDANMLAANEITYGAGQTASDFLVINVDRGIGLGIVAHGEVYRGSFGGAGELGHIRVRSSRLCPCGKVGCLEGAVASLAICQQVSEACGLLVTSIGDAVQLAASNRAAARVFDRVGRQLGMTLGNLVCLFNPERIVLIGNTIETIKPFISASLEAGLRETAFDILRDECEVEYRDDYHMQWAHGAACMVVHEMFKSPLFEAPSGQPLDQIMKPALAEAG